LSDRGDGRGRDNKVDTVGEIVAVINIIPVEDTWEHIESSECWCAPRVELIEGSELIIHNADDCREMFENIESN
jgi:hypothetical protein